jgi:hypothetical protein
MRTIPDSLHDFTHADYESTWPSLPNSKHSITSEKCTTYNCVAWAVGCNTYQVDLTKYNDNGIPIEVLDMYAYIEHFEGFGFTATDNVFLEEGVEKIALYFDNDLWFTHVCRQLSTGEWASKLGDLEDIEHSHINALMGSYYGNEIFYMSRNSVI